MQTPNVMKLSLFVYEFHAYHLFKRINPFHMCCFIYLQEIVFNFLWSWMLFCCWTTLDWRNEYICMHWICSHIVYSLFFHTPFIHFLCAMKKKLALYLSFNVMFDIIFFLLLSFKIKWSCGKEKRRKKIVHFVFCF